LLDSPTVRDAAKAAGVSEATLFRWLNDEAFRRAYDAARETAFESALAGLQAACNVAVKTLREVAEDPGAGAQARVAAAKGILDHAIKARELNDVVQRIEQLEKELAERQEEKRKLVWQR